ncbi:MAG TPA: glycosyltransferase [Thermoanaerobaculia bacterium]|nr:glycosyltransferase [Thermoanaerobaculia bacterium]
MRIVQIVLEGASAYERKSQAIDAAALAPSHEIALRPAEPFDPAGAGVAHVYGPFELPFRLFARFPLPYVASGRPAKRRFALRSARQPGYVVAPVSSEEADLLPEAVDERYFATPPVREAGPRRLIGTFAGGRHGVRAMVEQTAARIARFRDDVDWHLFDTPPGPEDLARLDAWVDPAVDERDYDGFVAEAVVCGIVTIASRTAVNRQRLEQGRTGLLVPPGDPNELAHAVLAALFKSEVRQQRLDAARQTASKFRPYHRLRVLVQMYANLLETARDTPGLT